MKNTVLIVEDDKFLLELMSHKLKQDGYAVETAQDGWEALDLVNNHKVDLIISDVMMPHISGLSLLSLINSFYFSRIPVIMISSLQKSDVMMSAMSLGANDFMTKPLNFDVLSEKIKKLLGKNTKEPSAKRRKKTS